MSTNEGRKILVVGGACGMGAATVAALYRQGANLIVLDINEEAMEELIEDEELEDGPGTLHFVAGDVNDASVRQEAIGYAKEEFGTLDSLLYIAGVLDLMCPAHKTDDELYDYVMDVNVNWLRGRPGRLLCRRGLHHIEACGSGPCAQPRAHLPLPQRAH